MFKGFFTSSQKAALGRTSLPLIPRCGACGLYEYCESPKMPVSGRGKERILILGEAPGEDEDRQGKQFVGKTGRLLERTLRQLGIDMRKDCWLTNSLICRPPNNKTPTDKQLTYCRPNLTKTLEELKPRMVLTFGAPAIKSLLMSIWKEKKVGAMTRWAGWTIPCQKPNMWICPQYHPSFIARLEEKNPAALLIWKRQLKKALECEGKPWEAAPDFASIVKVIQDTHQAADYILKFRKNKIPIAFDYETNMLKPDYPEAEIVCCSVSDGATTIAFPWHGEAVKEMSILLKSKVPKIGANIKFEQRWTSRILGHGVNNWIWDDMNNAHVLDFRSGITSVKFQAFVRFGAPDYNSHIEPYLKKKKGSRVNRIRELDLHDLLLYAGLDSLYEFMICKDQIKEWRAN